MVLRYASQLIPDIDKLPSRRRASFPEIHDDAFWRFYEVAAPYSLAHITGFYNAFQAMKHVATSRIPGTLVECGCFLGGMSIFMALLREHLGLDDRALLLFDTFTGYPPGSEDVFMGTRQVGIQLDDFQEVVRVNFISTLGHTRNVEFVRGPVEETAPRHPVERISLLRLDTDFYSSTRAELECFYPKLVSGGALIIDDYGMVQGARRATDEYLSGLERPPLLNRIDVGIWAGVKP